MLGVAAAGWLWTQLPVQLLPLFIGLYILLSLWHTGFQKLLSRYENFIRDDGAGFWAAPSKISSTRSVDFKSIDSIRLKMAKDRSPLFPHEIMMISCYIGFG